MRLLNWAADGGKNSHVSGLYIIEIKPLFSIVLLHFRNGTREAFHSHAFHAVTWVLKGRFEEHMLDGRVKMFNPSLRPKFTFRSTFHKVVSFGDTWAISFRGPWVDKWKEFLPGGDRFVTLTHGRKVIS